MIVTISWWVLGTFVYLTNVKIVYAIGECLVHPATRERLIKVADPKEHRILTTIAWTWPLAYVLLILFFWSGLLGQILELTHKLAKGGK